MRTQSHPIAILLSLLTLLRSARTLSSQLELRCPPWSHRARTRLRMMQIFQGALQCQCVCRICSSISSPPLLRRRLHHRLSHQKCPLYIRAARLHTVIHCLHLIQRQTLHAATRASYWLPTSGMQQIMACTLSPIASCLSAICCARRLPILLHPPRLTLLHGRSCPSQY
jgi:hypothetical protein